MLNYKKYLINSQFSYILSRFIIAGIFIYAGTIKIVSPEKFASIISNYGIVPEPFLLTIAIALPVFEILTGLGLIFDLRFSLDLISGMLLLFIGVLWFGILNNLAIDCGCFSTEDIAEQNSLKSALYKDFVLITMVLYCYIWRYFNNRRVIL